MLIFNLESYSSEPFQILTPLNTSNIYNGFEGYSDAQKQNMEILWNLMSLNSHLAPVNIAVLTVTCVLNLIATMIYRFVFQIQCFMSYLQ